MSSLRGYPLRSVAQLALAAVLLGSVFGAQAQSVSNGQTLYNKVFASGTNSCAAAACHGPTPSTRMNKIQLGTNAYMNKAGVMGVGEMNFLEPHLSDSDYNDLAAYITSVLGGTANYIPVATAPAVTLSASSLAFGSQTIGQASAARTVTLTNSGTAALAISGIVRSGSAFASTNDCPASLAAGSSCTISNTFTPTTAGSATGSVSISSNATGAPHAITLSGTGTTAAVANFGWSSATTGLSFSATVGSSSAVQTLTLLNSGSVAGTIATVVVSGADAADFVTGGSCGAGVTLDPAASCTVTVAFDPAAAGSRSAALQVSSSNASTPTAVALAGTASAAAGSSNGATANSNVGGGGCSVAASGRPFDPLLLTLGALAALGLAWRRWRAAPR